VTLTTLALTESVKAHALALGFDRVAVGPAGPADHASRFEQWLDAGYAAGMDYLARTRADRGDPGRLLPGCRSVVAVALAYGPREDDPSWSPVSRYARGGDYHELMRADRRSRAGRRWTPARSWSEIWPPEADSAGSARTPT
jgi:epoxyqueuosine reductase